MTGQLIAPVIPSAAGSARRRPGRLRTGGPLPLASPPGRPEPVYGLGRIDASGRIADRAVISALGWRGGDRLTLTASAGVMAARRDPGGIVTVPIFRSMLGNKLKGIKGHWVDEIERLQYYHARNRERRPLYLLDHNNNIGKHQVFHGALVAVDSSRIEIGYAHPDMGGRNFTFDNWLDGPIEYGREFLRITVEPPIRDPAIVPSAASGNVRPVL